MISTSVGQDLQRATPESQGIASAAVLQFIEALEEHIHEVHSFMLLRHSKVIAEGWWSPYGPEHPHLLFSLSKSFTSTAVGFAIAEGRFSLDDRVLSFFRQEMPADDSGLLAGMRVRHLLTMSTGQAVDTWSSMVDRHDGNWIQGFLSVPVLYPPGTHFVYNTGATYMLSAIVEKTTGMKLLDYLEPRFFVPLGIENARWQESPEGITAGGIGLCLKTEDVAKFGQLYLQKGMWQGRQILSEEWIEAATTSQISNDSGIDIDWRQGYGYQFWRSRHGTYRGDGVFGQFCIIMPEQDAVLAMTSGLDIFDMQQQLNVVWDNLLPAMHADALPENASAQDALAGRLSSLSFVPVQGEMTSPIASQVSGRTYTVDANELGIESILWDFKDTGCTVTIETASSEETITCGYRQWQSGQTTTLFKQPLLFERTPISVSGALTSEDTFTIIARLVETPFYYTLACHFVGDEMLLEIVVNTSLDSMKPLILLAHSV